ncbi:MAG: HAMP domain-containing sensor histidine kinase, partial [Bacteroidota bacterium]
TNDEIALGLSLAGDQGSIGIASILMLLAFGGFVWYRYRQRIVLKEKSIELEQERARQEQQRKEAEKLQELDAMKTRFFTNISHEFRTPLTLILGQNEQLQRAVPDPELQNRFQMVDRNGHRLLDLINQVLDVAKLEAGGMQLEPASLNAIPFLKHMLYSFESLAMEQEIRLVFKSDTKQLTTAFDLKKMERILFNLLSNAIKFSKPDSEISMIVKARPEQMIIGVRDTGVGIKSEQLPNIFDRFYQADSSEQQPQPGTGIGLSLVKELVELHDGSIRVESELGIGTTFWLHLPIPADL